MKQTNKDTTINPFLRQNINALLEARGISEAQFARTIQQKQTTIHKLVSGNTTDPRISTLIPIAKFAGVSIEQLTHEFLDFSYGHQNTSGGPPRNFRQLPLLEWEEIITTFSSLKSLTPLNWPEWININQLETSSLAFATIINSIQFAPPFDQEMLLIIDPNKPLKNQKYGLFANKKTNALTLKKIYIEGDETWLISLQSNIPATLFELDKYNHIGMVAQIQVSY